ncbi:glycosyltransferase family 2 protein, partial [Candidatus Omnitrophota bacterium]
RIGLYRKIYELYFEETDFNVRAKQAGFRVVVVKQARVWHKKASTMDRLILRRAYLLLRNLFIFELLNAKIRHLLVFIPYYFLIHLPYFLIRGSVYTIGAKLKGMKVK